MLSLSIVIPAQGSIESLEQGLVSVLQHRPADAEVLVVLNRPYDDPYHLVDEVRFLHAPPSAGFVACANLGLKHAQAAVVHLLASGVEVTEGWTDAPLGRFAEPRVAAVAPSVLDARDRQSALSEHSGPCGLAAFYRRAPLEALGGFDPAMGDVLADLDLALALEELGYVSIVEPRSIVYHDRPETAAATGFHQARQAQRLCLRHAATPSTLAVAALGTSGAAQFIGRLAAWGEWLIHRRYRRRLAVLRERLAVENAGPRPGLRLDASHRTGEAGAAPLRVPLVTSTLSRPAAE